MEAQFVLFLDPDTKQFYSFCEERGTLVKEKPLPSLKDAIKHDLKVFGKIMKWQEKQKIKGHSSFQLRPISLGYLSSRKYRFPVFSTQQPIKEATLEQIKLNDDGFLVKGQYKQSIQTRVYLGSIKQQVEPAKKIYPKMNSEYISKIQIKLITSANQVIRAICRTILQDYKIVIVTKNEKTRLILKVRNREEYFLGNEPLSNYQHVIDCLRDDKMLEVEIFQTEINIERQQFQKFIFSRRVADLEKGHYQPFPWERLLLTKNCGFLLWYKPDPFFIDRDILEDKDQPELRRINQNIKNKIQATKKRLKNKIPRYILKESIEIFVEKRRKQIQKKLVSLEGSTIFSGECNFAYAVEVMSISNLYSLFNIKKPQNRPSKRCILKLTSSKQPGEDVTRDLLTANKRYSEVLKYRQSLTLMPYQVNLIVQFYYNGEIIHEEVTQNYLVSNQVDFNEKIKWGYRLADLMLQTVIVFKVQSFSKEGQKIICGVGLLKMFDQYGFLRQGDYQVQMHTHDKINLIKLGCYNHKFDNKPKNISTINVKLPKFRNPVRWTLNDPKSMGLFGYHEGKLNDNAINVEQRMPQLTKLLSYNPLKMLKYTKQDKQLLRAGKKYYKHQSDKLINYLYSVNWTVSIQVAEAYQALKDWTPLKPVQALFLLTPKISDEKVRYFAVKILDKMKNSDFCLYSNQITQALVSFQTNDNPLIDLIIQRSCAEPFTVGHQYFWQFWNRKDQQITEYRFNLYLESLLLTSPNRDNLNKQILTYKLLVLSNAELISSTENMYFYQKDEFFKSKCKKIEQSLMNMNPDGFSFPIRPQIKFQALVKQQCRMFDSKKLPFSLCCAHNIEDVNKGKQKSYKVMFKCGDDIKQDHLVLQMLTIFNKLWIEAGFDLKMNIYRVLSTDIEIGFIELVDDSENSSKIHKDYSQKIMEALDDRSTLTYLEKNNPDSKSLRIAKENFIRSSAAYLVATYVLGIGDRHSGNYMVQKNGKFFHIDFGHILGNFKTKMGVKRERTPFVFTSEFAFVMDGEKSKQFARFERYCSNAYNVLRKNASLIINLLIMMVGTDIPQLKKYSDLEYLVDQLRLDLSQLQAQQHLIRQIKKTLQSESRKYDNFIHEKMRFG